MDRGIYNKAIELSLEWGMNFGKPIRERLLFSYPDLKEEMIERLQAESKEIQTFAFNLYWIEADGEITLVEARNRILGKYPLLDDDNLSRLESQGMYYARK